jgi:hypothetical protein
MTGAAVLFEQIELPPPEAVAEVFEREAQFPRPVALRLAQRAKWFAWENAPAAAAAAVCRGLIAGGLPARVIPQASVVPAASPRRIHTLQLDGDALGVQLKYTGPPQWIDWSDVLVLSAGAIKAETRKLEVHETLTSRGLRLVDERVQVDITRTILADIYARLSGREELLHLRLNSHEMNYAQAIGGSAQEGWREKFSLLLARLGLKATAAFVSPQMEALLAARLVPDDAQPSAYFADEDEFSQFNRWLATRKLLGWPM